MNTRLVWLGMLLAACGGGGADDAGIPDAAPTGVEAKFSSLYGDYFANCKNCHTPTAPGRTTDTEKTLDFSSQAMAYTTITTGKASGLTGNFAGCNGVPFIMGSTPGNSLLLASIDQPTRNAFDLAQYPNCAMDSIADQTLKLGSQPSPAFIAALKTWLLAGAPNN